MTKIKDFEEVMNGEKTFEETGIKYTLYWAYVNSKASGNEIIDFDNIIWIREIPEIVKQCKKYNINYFTISSSFSSLIPVMAEFQNQGCKIDGLHQIRAKHVNFITGEPEYIPAIKFIVE